MTKKKKALIAVGVLLAVLLVAGVTAVAVTSYGTQSDPLVTLSYLNDTAKREILNDLESTVSRTEADLVNKFDSKLGSGGGASEFAVVTLAKGNVVTCAPGAEIMLRVGSAASFGSSSPTLVDTTTGSDIADSGTALVKNHMYMVTIDGNGITATSGTVKILIRGAYVIG